MDMTVVSGFCMALEAAEVVGRKVNGEDYQQTKDKFLMRYGNRFSEEEKKQFIIKMRTIQTIYGRIYDQIPCDDMTQFLFRKYYYGNTYSSLAQILLINFLDISVCEVEDYIEKSRIRCRKMLESKVHIEAISFSALVLGEAELPLRENLISDIDKLDYPYEFRWNLVKVLTNYEFYFDELCRILLEASKILFEELKQVEPYVERMKAFWKKKLSDNAIVDLAISMGLKEEKITGKTAMLQILCMPCDMAIIDEEWDCDTLPVFLGLCVEWGSHFSFEELDTALLCEELRAFGEDSKFEILCMLKDEGAYGKEIAHRLNLDAATVSRHLAVLQKCGLIYMERREGRNVYYRTNQGEIRNLIELIQKIFITEIK